MGAGIKQMDAGIKEIRELARKFTPEEIEGCITDQMSTGQNVCLAGGPPDRVVGELAKAEFVRELMEKKGMSLADALRELARRIRLLRKGYDG